MRLKQYSRPLVAAAAMIIMLLSPALADMDVDTGCVHGACHQGMGKAKVVHDPLDDCSNCHEANEGVAHNNITKIKAGGDKAFDLTEEYPDLCLDCHDDVIQDGAEMHSPVEDGECGECHDPHQSNNYARLRKPVNETCLSCHDDMADTIRNARSTHDALDEDEGCAKCHDPHSSKNEYFLKVTPVAKLCYECHDDLIDAINEVPPEYRHGPIRKGQCQKCHNPHGSRWPPLLQKPFVEGLYAPFRKKNYALCLSCHDKLDLRKPGPRSKPIKQGFANGNQNLHYKHVNRQKGRTCRFCHDMHSSPEPHLLREKIQFGRWTFDLNWALKGGKGECTPACHARQRYDKAAPLLPLLTRGAAPATAVEE